MVEMEFILDVRPAEAFERLHRAGSVNIPLEELADRIHELPRRDQLLFVFDEAAVRARWAASRLRARSRAVEAITHGSTWLKEGPVSTGPSRDHLWRPHALLEEAVTLASRPRSLTRGPRALDIACGMGRDAVFLAMSGFRVEAWDNLPDALTRCEDLARRNRVAIETRCRDVEADPRVDPAAYDLICCFNFLHRPLMPQIAAGVRPGGLVVYETFVHPQRDLFGKPRREQHLLKPDELPSWFVGWEILHSAEGLRGPRRLAASLIARRPTGGSFHGA